VDFEVRQGEILGIIGPNGSGKTTLLKILGGLLVPSEGAVRLKDRSIAGIPPRERAMRIGMVLQEPPGLFAMSVLEMVALGRAPYLSGMGFLGRKDWDIVDRAMKDMDLFHLKDRPLAAISGGERQRVLIARAMAQEVEVLLLDEPTTHLDIGHQQEIQSHLTSLNRGKGLTLIVVSHDLNLAGSFCRTLVLLHRGAVVEWGKPEAILTEEKIRDVYACPVLVDRHPVSGAPRLTLLEKKV
jgi:iron complex transport system ATP-binding protein